MIKTGTCPEGCGRQNKLSLPQFHILILSVCEYVTLPGKRDFADVVKNLEIEKLSRLSGGANVIIRVMIMERLVQ